MENGLNLKEKARIIRNSIHLINKADKGHTARAFLRLLPEKISAFAGIFLASLVVDGLLTKKPLSYLLLAAGIVCGVDLLVYGIKNLIDIKQNSHDFSYHANTGKILAQKVMNIDYALVENIEIKNKLERAENWITNRNMGIPGMEESAVSAFRGLFSAILGAAFIAPILFREKGEQSGFLGFVQSGWCILLLLILLTVLTLLQSFVFQQRMTRILGRDMNDKEVLQAGRIAGNFRGFALFNYRNGKEIRLYSEEELIMDKYYYGINFTAQRLSKSLGEANKIRIYMHALDLISQLLLYGFAVTWAVGGIMSPGEVVAFVMYFSRLQEGFIEFASNLGGMFTRAEFCQYVFDFLDIADQKYKGSIPTEKRDDNEYEFEFCHVSFHYPDSQEDVLKDICLKWKIGEKMALVGKNGCGKSTLIKLLCRLYDPTEGKILLNGIDIKKYKYEEYMALFSIVFQDSGLFSFPMAENVAADTQYDEKLVTDCVERAGLKERLANLEDGIKTCLYKDFDERGVEISGGEAQKLCLARAIYKGAPFIILDEPTAALDPVSEYEIYTKFNRIVGTRTAIYISHRLSSCRFCDEITVMENGRIIERGSHKELLKKEGAYQKLWSAQAEYYKENAGKLFEE